MLSRLKTHWLGFISAMAILLTAVGLVSLYSADAMADGNTNSAVMIDRIKVVKSSVNGDESSGTVHVYSTVKVSWYWDATNANPQPGQNFVLGLPKDPVVYRPYDLKPFDLTVEHQKVKYKVAVCTPFFKKDAPPPRITCEFQQGLQDAKNAGLVNLTGSASFIATAHNSGTATSANFDANGQVIPVPNPGGKPIGPDLTYSPYKPSKSNRGINSGSTEITWNINFEGQLLKKLFKNQAFPESIVFDDFVGTGHTLTGKAAFFIDGTKAAGKFQDPLCLGQTGGACNVASGNEYGKFNVAVSLGEGNKKATLSVTPTAGSAILDEANYRIQYTTVPTGGIVDQETIYYNQWHLVGTDVWRDSSVSYTATAFGDAQMEQGYGTFIIGKRLGGEGRSLYSPDAKVRFQINWELPSGKTADSYDGWTAPSNPFYMEVPIDKKVAFPAPNPAKPFPLNTRITITEVMDWQVPAGVTLDTPTIQIDNGDETTGNTVSFTIKSKNTTGVTVSNVANKTALPKVRVGDYVFEDVNDNGRQDTGTDKPIQGVELSLSKKGGDGIVKSFDGTTLTGDALKQTTNDQGKYLFENLAPLPAGEHYVVTVTRPPAGFQPAKAGVGSTDLDSSNGSAESTDLTTNGAEDLTLDFGYVRVAPRVDIEKYDGQWDGVQFNAGKPALSENGQPTNLPAGDRDTTAQAIDLTGKANTVVNFKVTNTGNEDLKNVRVTDTNNAGPALTNLTCTFGGTRVDALNGTVTSPEAFILRVGEAVDCTATLPSMGYQTAHEDTAKVVATPVTTTGDVEDSDKWHAKATPPKVRVGDYVFEDVNDNGRQDTGTDKPIQGVELSLSKKGGDGIVKSFDGTTLTGDALKQTTNDQGKYLFENLAPLPAGEHYVVTVTRPPAGFQPAKAGVGSTDLDSSNGSAESTDLTTNGAEDLTLDFGYVRVAPRVDIEKYDGQWDGVQFNAGKPALSENGQPTNLPAGDRDTTAQAIDLTGKANTVVNFKVTNTGNEDLKNVRVTDTNNAGPALTNLTCTFGGTRVDALNGTVTSPEAFILRVGEAVDCTATLPSMGYQTAHEDTAKVVATPVTTTGDVEDSDKWHAKATQRKVSVGDFVWFDKNDNGIQDDGADSGIDAIQLEISRSDQQPVKKFDGSAYTTITTTNAQGKYLFENLEPLPAGKHYVVTVKNAPAGYKPAKTGQGTPATDSSVNSAESTDLTTDGAKDLTLDFGFVKKPAGIDIEKYDAEGVAKWGGVTFTGDLPNLTDSQPSVLPVGDRDTEDAALVLRSDARATVFFTITNTGEDGLKNIVVSDKTLDGPPLTDIVCTIDGKQVMADQTGVVSLEADYVLAPKKSFECQATMPALGDAALHHNKAMVEATPVAGGAKVKDEDHWNAKPKPKVSVGDFVWFDKNNNGLQDDGADSAIKDVVLTISRSDGKPVRNADGAELVNKSTTTNASGLYKFENLEVIDANTQYVVTVTAPAGYKPTKAGLNNGAGENDSSTGRAISVKPLATNGAEDLTLDFGFVKKPVDVDIEKYDGNWGGVQFNGDTPVLTNDQPATLPAGDRDTAENALVLSGLAEQEVKFTVTNTGEEALKNIVVSDKTLDGPALTDLKCTIDSKEIAAVDGVVSAPADWKFAPKASFQCTGKLPALTKDSIHANKGTVEATPVAGGEPVKDEDEWHAKRAKVSVGDYVWFDANADGLQDTSDVPLKDVTLTISRTDNKPVKKVDGTTVTTTKTDAEGKYLFADLEILPAGEKYVVTVTAPDNYEPTTANAGADRAKDSSTASETANELTKDGDKDLTLDFGFVKKPTGIDIEKHDGDWGGVQFNEDGSPKLTAGQPAMLPAGDHDSDADALVLTGMAEQEVKFTVTNTGKGELTKVKVSDKTLDGPALTDLKCTIDSKEIAAVDGVVSAPADWKFAPKASFQCTGKLPALTKDSIHANKGTVEATPVAGGEPVKDEDEWHAKRAKVSVGDYVWFDANKDGLQDDGEKGIQDVVLTISRTDNKPVKKVDGTTVTTTKTDAEGKYLFADLEILPAGEKYVVTVTAPDNYEPTTANAGADRAKDSSTASETANELTKDGDKDLTLDFGFVKKPTGIDIEKHDGDWGGVQFNEDGSPKLTAGQPAMLPAGDHDSDADALVLTGMAEQEVKFTVTNTGKGELTKVKVSDKTLDGPALTDLKCTIDSKEIAAVDGVVSAPADWKFAPKASFQCTGKLPALTKDSIHANKGTVEATPVAGGEPVKDEDEWHAKRAKVSVGDYVWFDANKDGLQDDGEKGIQDVVLTISRTDNKPVKKVDGTTVTTTKTDAEGKYLFADLEILPAGEKYVVTVTAPDNYEPTTANAGADRAKDSSTASETANELTKDGDKDLTLDFGFVKKPTGIDIEKHDGDWGGVQFNEDGSPKLTAGQPAMLPAGDHDSDADALVLTGMAEQEVKFTVTNTGKGELTKVKVSDKTLDGPALTDLKCTIDSKEIAAVDGVVSAPADWKFAPKASFQCTGKLPALTKDSIHANKGTVEATPVAGGEPVKDEDEWHAKRAKVSVGDYVWFDANKDGLQDDGEKGIQDVVLTISRTDNKPVKKVDGTTVTTTKTDAEGKYLFADLEILPAGEKYVVTVTDPAGYVATKAEQGSNRAKDSSTGSATAVELTQDGAKDLTLDFGFFFPEVSVGDYVWFDTNKDGLQDGSDVPLKDVVLAISRSDGKAVNNADHTPRTELTTTTDTNGKYAFNGLVPRQVVGRISSCSKVGMVALARPRWTSRGRLKAIASCGRWVLYSTR